MKGLEGVKVVELCGYVAAPAGLRVLGEMGATIYKIEAFTGDEYRTNGPGFGIQKGEVDDPSFDLASINKTWLAVNLKTGEGMDFLMKLLAEADIFITSFRDKALKKLGLDYETLHEKFPGLVWGQMRGYGERGPEKDSKGFDATAYSARGGLFACFPQKDEGYQPINIPAAFGDWNASIALVAGVMAALVRKQRSGEGDKVTVNLYHMACWAMQIGIAATQFGDEWPKSRRNAPCPTNNTYQTSDGVWFLICYGSYDIYFEQVMRGIGLEQLIGDKRYDTLAEINRTGANKEVIKMMEDVFAQHDWAYWEPVLRDNDIPYQKLNLLTDVIKDEEAFDNDILRTIHYDEFGDHVMPTSPIRFDSVGDPVMHRSRPIGYDTREVMHEYGYDDAQVDKCVEDGAVKCYEGPALPESVLAPIYGPDSKRD